MIVGILESNYPLIGEFNHSRTKRRVVVASGITTADHMVSVATVSSATTARLAEIARNRHRLQRPAALRRASGPHPSTNSASTATASGRPQMELLTGEVESQRES